MPIKFKPTQKTLVRGTKNVVTQHFYIKNTPKEELIDYINNGQKPKIKQKCRNELTRRGVKLVWKSPTEE
mgnify:FL=1|tara:strand:+ start:610 stop:819 length:210 start_codon:yes stop_codon:yes gene_type:complete